MIKKSSKQTGSVHIAIIIILIVAILGGLGFMFWNNFMKKDNDNSSNTQQTSASKVITYATYQTDIHPVSFQYPSTWKVKNVEGSGQDFFRSANITTDENNAISFSIGAGGLGGTCGGSNIPIHSTIDVTPTTLKTPKTTTLSFTVARAADGSYDAKYGLTDEYTKLGDAEVCDNVFYYYSDTGNATYNLIEFSGTKHFATLDDAKKFIASDEYMAIKKMILSLSY